MGWSGKDAVGEILNVGDKVVYFRDKSLYNRGEGIEFGSTGYVSSLERDSYDGRGSVRVDLEAGFNTWMCHIDLMKV